MSDVETTDDLVFTIDDSSIEPGLETDSNKKSEPRRAITLARRLAVLLLVFAGGSVIYPRVFGSMVHDRSSEMLEQRLASDLKNGVAPISNPIEPGTPMALVEIPSRDRPFPDNRVSPPFLVEVANSEPSSRISIVCTWGTRSS
jgi:hypothetical protein